MKGFVEFKNDTCFILRLAWEPYGDLFEVPPGATWRLEAELTTESFITIKHDRVVIETPDSAAGFFESARVLINGEVVWG